MKPEFVDTLLAPYFEIQMGLANDKWEIAKPAAAKFQNALKQGPSAEEAPEMKAFTQIAKTLNEAKDIEKAREAFHSLSKEMITLVDHVGAASTTAYQMHCTMGFGYTGASWLQANDKLINPYWGARMLRCGHEEAIYAPKK